MGRQDQAIMWARADSEQSVRDQTDEPPDEEVVSIEGTEEEVEPIASDQIDEVEEVVGPEVDVRDRQIDPGAEREGDEHQRSGPCRGRPARHRYHGPFDPG